MNKDRELRKTSGKNKEYLDKILDCWMERDRQCMQNEFERIRDICLANNTALLERDMELIPLKYFYHNNPEFRKMCDEDEIVRKALTQLFEEDQRNASKRSE
jgi:hypothetical protein